MDTLALEAEKSTRRKFNLHYVDVLQAEIEALQDDILTLEKRLGKLEHLHLKGSEDA